MVFLAAGALAAAALAPTPAPTSAPTSAPTPAAPLAAPAPARSGLAGGFADSKWGDGLADAVSTDSYGRNQAQNDPGSLYNVERSIGARALWAKRDASMRQVTGEGVGVAVLDSGVAEVPGLDATGKVIQGPDLSIEENGVLVNRDTFGHGTFMAGIIGGRATTNPSSDLPSAPADVQLGVAPDATLLAMKLATTDGSSDVSEVIAALDWVTQHPVLPDGTRIRVVNLSYGTYTTQGYELDPLAAAAENAWKHGIVVVTSAGNAGSDAGTLSDPAVDPFVLAVGATDNHEQTSWDAGHTTVASFSNVGTTARHVDVVAPGTSIVSARDPGSYVDVNFPQGRVAGDLTGRLFRGSGTSQAAAVVSGSVALLLQAFPTLTPDQVKYVLTGSADQLLIGTAVQQGAGTIDLTRAFALAAALVRTDNNGSTLRAAAVQSFAESTGQGSLDAARGGTSLVDAAGRPLLGEVDVQGNPWVPSAWWRATSTMQAWDGGKWLGTTWTGADWDTSGGLTSARWTSARWTSARWTSADWSSARWTSSTWSSARWTSSTWSSARWTSASWLDPGW